MFILGVSTTSPLASIALFESSQLLAEQSELTQANASGAVLTMLDRMLPQFDINIADVERFIVDVGPGSFTGTRVGVNLVKAFAFADQKTVAAVNSFDLVSTSETVAIPAGQNQFCLRIPGITFEVVAASDDRLPGAIGWGSVLLHTTYPEAKRARELLTNLAFRPVTETHELYSSFPNISQPKSSYRTVSE